MLNLARYFHNYLSVEHEKVYGKPNKSYKVVECRKRATVVPLQYSNLYLNYRSSYCELNSLFKCSEKSSETFTKEIFVCSFQSFPS